jgi:hypothetical protein
VKNDQAIQTVIAIDQQLRKIIAEYFMAIQQMNDPVKGVNLLAEHVSIMIEMINELKK